MRALSGFSLFLGDLMAATLLQLRTRARQRADMENSKFVSDSELNDYINSSIAELHDILIQSYGEDYYINETTFSTIVGQESYDLPTDFYKMRGVDARLTGTRWLTLQPYNFNERNRFEDFGVWDLNGTATIRYRILGNKVRFTPNPDRVVEVRLFYVPMAQELVNDTDQLTDFNQYSEYVITDAAIKMLVKEESDATPFVIQKAALKERIETASKNRDVGSSESISDIYAEDHEDYFYRTDS